MCREVRIRFLEERRKILNIWLIRDICKGNWKVCQAQTRAKKRKTEIAKALSLHFVISFDFTMARFLIWLLQIICPSVCVYVCCVCLSVCLCVCVSVCLFDFVPVYMSSCLSARLSVCLSDYPYLCMYVFRLSVSSSSARPSLLLSEDVPL